MPPPADLASSTDLQLLAPWLPGDERVLTPQALAFVAALDHQFRARCDELLAKRDEVQSRFDAGALPDFLPETRELRETEWRVAPIPADLLDRRVEITGPVDRKMVINALNSGANTYMADFEDSTAPTWRNLIDGQANLIDAVRRTITFESAGKHYQLNERTATLLVRPRGWHLPEAHILREGKPLVGALFDFGLYLFHNGQELLERGTGPYFYLPKMQSHHEAALWNDVFSWAQAELGLPHGSIRATVLIETLPAAFQMDEILWQLRDHSAGLNCGRWDYIFSYIKTLRAHADKLVPDRGDMAMTQPALRAYTRLVVQTCHRRGIHAMGGMAAQIPIKGDDAANAQAMARVVADKQREAGDGHDGTWVAHPALVAVAKAEFDAVMPGSNQIERTPYTSPITQAELLAVPTGKRTEAGLRHSVRVALGYLEAWLRGVGCVPLHHLMEDAATAEISRAQVWQWQHHGARLDDGRVVDAALVRQVIAEELAAMGPSPHNQLAKAGALFAEWSTAPELADFLTLSAYPQLL
jgi:malate synthase